MQLGLKEVQFDTDLSDQRKNTKQNILTQKGGLRPIIIKKGRGSKLWQWEDNKKG